MTQTRDEWLSGLSWNDGPPPTTHRGDYPAVRAGLVYETRHGGRIIVGDINDDGGSCGCCDGLPELKDVVRWAELFGGNP